LEFDGEPKDPDVMNGQAFGVAQHDNWLGNEWCASGKLVAWLATTRLEFLALNPVSLLQSTSRKKLRQLQATTITPFNLQTASIIF